MVLPGDVIGVANATEDPRERVLDAIMAPGRDDTGPDPGMADADGPAADAIDAAVTCAHSSTVTTPGSLSAS